MSNGQTSSKAAETRRLVIKLALGAVLIFYVLRSGMIDFALVGTLLRNPTNLIVAFAFQGASMLLCGIRWYLLMRAQTLRPALGNSLALTMIGLFFNTFMPGSVGGDLIKAWYIAGQEPQRKTRAVFTVLVDRIIGLTVIIFYSAITLLFYQEWIAGRPQLHVIAAAIWGFTAAAILFGVLFFIPALWDLLSVDRLMKRLERIPRLHRLCEAAIHYRHHLPTVAATLALSAVSVLGINLLYKFQGDALGIPMTMAQYFFVVPLALTASAIPILPGGLGVGQVAFYTLFAWTGSANPQQGATLCTVLQAYTILFNCIGAVFYLKYKRSPQSSAATGAAEMAVRHVESRAVLESHRIVP